MLEFIKNNDQLISKEMLEKRDDVLARVKELRKSHVPGKDLEKSEKLELELAALHPILSKYLVYLTKAAFFASAGSWLGYLWNYGQVSFVYADGNNKWLYAACSSFSNATRFSLFRGSGGVTMIRVLINGKYMYFNWNNVTGACKLYPIYSSLELKWDTPSDTEVFKILNTGNNESIGCWSDSNDELYNRTNVVFTKFGFGTYDTKAFNEDDWLIYNALLKHDDKV